MKKRFFATILATTMLATSLSSLSTRVYAGIVSDEIVAIEGTVSTDDITVEDDFDYIALNEKLKENIDIYEGTAELEEFFYNNSNEEVVQEEVITNLPSSVDISADEYFPVVGDQSFNGNCGYWSSYYHNFTYAYNKKHGIKTTPETCHNPIFGFAFYGRSLESDQFVAMEIGYPTMSTLPLDHYGTNCFSPTKEVWEDAIKHRTAGFTDYKRFGAEDSIVTGPDDPSLNQIKSLLANDLIVGIGTLSGKWNISVVGDGKHEGESIIDRCDIDGLGGHGISFVGYDDDIWVDINHDGQKQKAEYGAFKMVNSWGPDWANDGFIWVAYDAISTVSQAISSDDEKRINNAIANGTLKCNKVNNSNRMSFIWFETVSTLNLREKDTSGCICYITVNTGSRTEMRMSLTAISKADGKSTTWNFPSLVHDNDDYAWDGTKKATDATMAFDLDNLFDDISADKLDDYTWKATFGDTTKDDHSLVVKDVYIAADGVKKYVTSVSKVPLNGNERTYDLKSVASESTSDPVIEEENKKNVIIYYSNSNFKDANIHYRVGNGTWTGVPGVQMCTDGSQDGYTWKYIINLGNESQLTTCFNNGNNSWDSNGEKNYIISKPGCYGIKNGSIVELKEIVEIPAEELALDKETVELFEEEQAVVKVSITPAEATDKTVKWKSSDELVAIVSDGVITGIKEGSAVITAVTSNGLSKEVKVTVKVNPNIVKPIGIKVLPMELSLTKGDTYALNAVIVPDNTTNKIVKWSSSNAKVATINSQGLVTAVAKGNTEIIATTSNGLTATVEITVEEAEGFSAIEDGVYFEKPSGWGNTIYAYMWIEENGSSQKLLGTWPGTEIENIEGSIYGFSSTADEGKTMIIFNDGKNQTDDLKFYKNGYYDKNGLVKTIVLNGKVYVKCVDEDGNVLSINAMKGEVGTAYSAQVKDIEGYTLITIPTNITGKYSKEDITVTYVYRSNDIKEDLKVTAKVDNSTVKVGEKVTIKADAIGGEEPYTYSYIVYNSYTNQWARIADNIQSQTFSWTAGSVGDREFYVDVKDGSGKVVRSEAVKVNVLKNDNELSVSTKVSASNISVGEKVIFTATATGGNGKYTYSYIVYNKDNGSWFRLADNISENTYIWTAGSVGNRVFYIDVKDSTGKIVRSNAIEVATKDNITLSISGKTSNSVVKQGSVVTISGIATGGTAPYAYSILVHNKTNETWYRFSGFTETNKLNWMASGIGDREFFVEVKDATGKIVRSNAIIVNVR